jgi:hypothetical protein
MTLTPFYRRTLAFSAVSLLLGLVIRFWPEDSGPAVVAPTKETIAMAEQRLAHLREIAATVPGEENVLRKAQDELAGRERGLIVADTAAQAQAQLIQILRAVGGAENPPVEIRTDSFGLRPLGDAYGEASVGIQFDCRIDQLVNMLAGLAARQELVSTSDLHVGSTASKDKNVSVHLTVSGVVPRKLVPEKRT